MTSHEQVRWVIATLARPPLNMTSRALIGGRRARTVRGDIVLKCRSVPATVVAKGTTFLGEVRWSIRAGGVVSSGDIRNISYLFA